MVWLTTLSVSGMSYCSDTWIFVFVLIDRIVFQTNGQVILGIHMRHPANSSNT
jgi:hypothetical protein